MTYYIRLSFFLIQNVPSTRLETVGGAAAAEESSLFCLKGAEGHLYTWPVLRTPDGS